MTAPKLSAIGIALLLGAGAASRTAAQDTEKPKFFVDPREGVVEGRPAVNVFPVEFRAGGPLEFLDPAGLEVHLAAVDDPQVEHVYPAGEWFHPPNGRYRAWIEGGWRMSRYSVLMSYSGSAAVGLRGPMPIGGAGRVALPADWEPGSDDVFELLHAGEYLEGPYPRWEISRRSPAVEVDEGLLMPAGTAIGAVWSRRERKYVAISRPFRVREGESREIVLERPRELAHVLVELRRSQVPTTASERRVEVALERGGKRLAADLEVLTADRVYAVWYDLEPGAAILDAEAPRDSAARQALTLMAGQIERYVVDLEALPALEVALDLPRAARQGELTLELRSLPEGEVVERRAVEPDADSILFERLPLELLEVRLGTPAGPFAEQVDLRSGADGFVVLEPDLVALHGKVYRGDAGHPATIELTTVAGETTEARTDEQGAYEVVVLRPLRSAEVSLAGVEAAPFFEVYWQPITTSRELDFVFPEVDFTARILDATTGSGIPGATVSSRNTFTPPTEDEAEEGPERTVAQSATADRAGLARLPPLRRGRVEIRASAEGYEELPEPVVSEVFDERTGQEFEVRLQPVGRTASLRLGLAGGRAAVGAEVLVVDSLATGNPLYSGRTDGEGRIALPRRLTGGLVLARHPEAAFFVGEWQPHEGEDDVYGLLAPAAGLPLVLEVKDSSGERPVAHAEIALWVEGRRLSGSVLGWLIGARPLADRNGFWTAANLPAGTVAILAWDRQVRGGAAVGRLDSQAVAVGFPWPEPFEVRAVQ